MRARSASAPSTSSRRGRCRPWRTGEVPLYRGPVTRDCVFCAIIAGNVQAELVLDEPDMVAFLDARPVFKGHTLLVPREHVVTLPDLPSPLRDPFLGAAQRLATAVVEGLGA